ncbi:GNAT family N-acetyltransferase [Lutibacter sp.]|uniref:GNAT family N-acetyltransferase n=1 Tax=Lutibacter sp. TaxID=1925666 RepID=UPI00273326DF|nr:GNAT family N-acetyltransferase [Lutibacter sp.]MDP3312422.1 GNAT family N-acetyltransferase [Lutibacter sp.]
MITIKKITAQDTYPIRLEVLRKNIPLPFQFNGDLDDTTFHLGAFNNDKLISVSSYMKESNNLFNGSQYQLRGMATLVEYQGKGVGKLMLENAISIIEEKNIDFLWCNARISAVNFYEKLGFKTVGEIFQINYVGEHYAMVKKLKNR